MNENIQQKTHTQQNKEVEQPIAYDLKSEIKSLGVSQLEFSEIVGVHNNTLTQWIRGKRKMPEWIKNFIIYYEKAKLFDELKEKVNKVN